MLVVLIAYDQEDFKRGYQAGKPGAASSIEKGE